MMSNRTLNMRREVIRLMGETVGTESISERELLVDQLIDAVRDERSMRVVELVG